MILQTITSRAFNQNASSAKRASRDGPVIITERGRPAHVLMSYSEFQRMQQPQRSLADIFAMPEGADVDIDLEIKRVIDPPKEIDWS